MSLFRQKLGKRGEDEALRYIKKEGYKLIERNFRANSGEIDLIARDNDTLVFIEVKARSSEAFGSPASAVGRRKMEHIVRASQEYLASIGDKDGERLVRFDVVSVLYREGDARVELIKDAFGADEF